MRCVDCETITKHVYPVTTLWLHLPTKDSFAKLAVWCGSNDYSARQYNSNGVAVEVAEKDFNRFITAVYSLFGKIERMGCQVVTTNGASPTENDIGRVMSLETFVNRCKAGWLVKSIEGDNYESWFQPIVKASSSGDDIFGHEALFRLRDDEGTIIPPGHVFEVAEHSDLLFSVDLVARRSAVETAARAGLKGKIFINFNPTSIYDPAYCLRTTAATIDELGLTSDQIVFEMVETHAASDLDHLRGILAFYRNAGFQVALDDVGSGFSGLNMLNALRPDYVKIDMDLVRDVDSDSYKQEIVQQLLRTAHNIGIQSIAEGIETDSEASFLIDAGADLLQGYYFGKPRPLAKKVDPKLDEKITRAVEPLAKASGL